MAAVLPLSSRPGTCVVLGAHALGHEPQGVDNACPQPPAGGGSHRGEAEGPPGTLRETQDPCLPGHFQDSGPCPPSHGASPELLLRGVTGAACRESPQPRAKGASPRRPRRLLPWSRRHWLWPWPPCRVGELFPCVPETRRGRRRPTEGVEGGGDAVAGVAFPSGTQGRLAPGSASQGVRLGAFQETSESFRGRAPRETAAGHGGSSPTLALLGCHWPPATWAGRPVCAVAFQGLVAVDCPQPQPWAGPLSPARPSVGEADWPEP